MILEYSPQLKNQDVIDENSHSIFFKNDVNSATNGEIKAQIKNLIDRIPNKTYKNKIFNVGYEETLTRT